jgi:hypothetical protein
MNLLIPELVKIEAKRTLLILHLRKIKAKRILFIPQIRKSEAERRGAKLCLFHKLGRKSVYSRTENNRSEANSAYSRNRQDRSEKNKLDRSLSAFFMLWSRGIDSKEPIPLANVA